MNPIVAPVAKAVEAISIWLNPDRKEKVILRNAIHAAKQIILILERKGEYQFMSDINRNKLKIHYFKQLNAWEDGTP